MLAKLSYSVENVKIIAVLLVLACLQGCTSASLDQNKETPSLPDKWQYQHNAAEIDQDWLTNFTAESDNAHLVAMIDEAIRANQNIRSQAFTADIAEQRLAVAKSNFWPSLDGAFGAARTQANGNSFSLEAQLSYEIDIWGALSDAERAAKLNYLSAQADLQEAKLQLSGNVIIAYANASRAYQRVELASQQVQNSTDSLDIIERGYRAGLNESLDVYLARNELNSDKSTLADYRQTLLESVRDLERLLGRYPNAQLDVSQTLSLPDVDVAVGLPSELVTRKPALQANWLALMAQDATLAIAHKARFPSLNLAANYGPSSDSLSDLLSTSASWSLIGNITSPIFNAGRLRANQEIELLTLKSLEESYLDAVLNALLAVENALSQEANLSESYRATQTAAENARIANQLSFEQYQAGLVTYTTVLEAQARLITAQNNLIDIQTDLIANRVQLHVALGGDINLYATNQEL
ncbi:efflux transporter outer membrane subunit [Aliiglaciecola lipolytica]|uniref:RND efflux system outer membrane lipoprotein n=1 Tax=Aliiglaciecola lipolytica E3 TaxID=1127673 RepID=K6Y867_9ALTE|nr:efflux transporter outer membrane subunit [Aliiglaciecola lipolytica]GAC12823.1 RND efflux system outer membrane lipoprotein [Aliiglaciecola lipolytica E3]